MKKILYFIFFFIIIISCEEDNGEPGGDKYNWTIIAGDTTNMKVYTLNYTFNLDSKDTLINYTFTNNDISTYFCFTDFNLNFYQDTNGGIFAHTNTLKLLFDNAIQNPTLTNSKGYNEHYGIIDNRQYDSLNSRNILYVLKKGAEIKRCYTRVFSDINCILLDSIYFPSELNDKIISDNSIYNKVFTPILTNTFFYYSFYFRNENFGCPCWIKCSLSNKIFIIHELAISKPIEKYSNCLNSN